MRELDFNESFGLKDMAAESIWELAERLADDKALHQDYLVRKMGLDPNEPTEVSTGVLIMSGKGIITVVNEGELNASAEFENYSLWPQLCLMTRNISVESYDECLSLDPTSNDSRIGLFLN